MTMVQLLDATRRFQWVREKKADVAEHR